MKNKKRDITALKKIIVYCNEIDATNEHFGNSLENLQSNFIYKNVVTMCVLQIGELVTHLTDEFIVVNATVPWRKIKDMRNITAHNYGEFSVSVLWEVITDDIPGLRHYCQTVVEEMQKNVTA